LLARAYGNLVHEYSCQVEGIGVHMSSLIDTGLEGFKLRIAEEKDTALILDFIKELAEYEKMLDCVVATEAILRESLFEKKAAEVIIGEYQGKPVGFALFFHNFSTFLGQAGIYLEDLYVKPEMRGKGIGKIILAFLAKLALDRNCGRLEWWVLDWNEPSIRFYKKMGAVPMDEWTVYRVSGDNLKALGDKF
jgi:GNAT superfamily N-acetyltransferase